MTWWFNWIERRGRRSRQRHRDLILCRCVGTATLKRRWDQHHPATIYWRPAAEKPVRWILLTGSNDGLAPVLTDRCLQIRRESESKEPIQFRFFALDLEKESIAPDGWRPPGLRVAVQRAVGVALERVQWIDQPRYGRCLEVRYATPVTMADGTPALTLRPKR